MHCKLLAKRSMALSIDIMHGRSPNNKMRAKLQPKKTKARLY